LEACCIGATVSLYDKIIIFQALCVSLLLQHR
jgi:hypothetical protein